jgi:hypothetical protein
MLIPGHPKSMPLLTAAHRARMAKEMGCVEVWTMEMCRSVSVPIRYTSLAVCTMCYRDLFFIMSHHIMSHHIISCHEGYIANPQCLPCSREHRRRRGRGECDCAEEYDGRVSGRLSSSLRVRDEVQLLCEVSALTYLWCDVVCCDVLCWLPVLCCTGYLCCAVLCCAVLCCAMLCCAVME